MGLGQYDSLEEYCHPYTASSVFLILVIMGMSECSVHTVFVKLVVSG